MMPDWPLFCFDDDGLPLWQCNECGWLVPIWHELCGPCAHKEYLDQMEESCSRAA